MAGDDETALLLVEKERVEAQWDALIDELKEQGYDDGEICRMLYSRRKARKV